METGDKVLENGGKTEAKNLAEKCPCPGGLCRTEFMSNEPGYLREISQKQSIQLHGLFLTVHSQMQKREKEFIIKTGKRGKDLENSQLGHLRN